MQTELIHFGIAIVVVVIVLLLLRSASKKSRASAPADTRARLGLEQKAEAPRRRPVKTAKKPEEAKPVEPEVEEEAAPPDEEAAAAYQAGLAKTRGGFVAKLGKLFGKKKIDAATVDDLEEVLFTADIGP